MKFKFISTRIIEADSMDEAKLKFADSSWNFAANAECHELEPSSKKKLEELKTTVIELIKDDLKYGGIQTEDQFYQYLQEYIKDLLLDFNLNLKLASSGLIKSDKKFREKTRELVFETVFLESINSVKESYPTLYKKIKEQR